MIRDVTRVKTHTLSQFWRLINNILPHIPENPTHQFLFVHLLLWSTQPRDQADPVLRNLGTAKHKL